MTKTELKELAVSLGITVDSDWTKAEIQTAVDNAEIKVESYKCAKPKFHILGVSIEDGFKLTTEQESNADFMRRFNYAVLMGIVYV